MTHHINKTSCLLILLACPTGCHTTTAKEGLSMPGTVGTKAPDVSFHLHDGSTVKLSDFEETPISRTFLLPEGQYTCMHKRSLFLQGCLSGL